MGGDVTVKIIDFNVAKNLIPAVVKPSNENSELIDYSRFTMRTCTGLPEWSAPEMLSRLPYT